MTENKPEGGRGNAGRGSRGGRGRGGRNPGRGRGRGRGNNNPKPKQEANTENPPSNNKAEKSDDHKPVRANEKTETSGGRGGRGRGGRGRGRGGRGNSQRKQPAEKSSPEATVDTDANQKDTPRTANDNQQKKNNTNNNNSNKKGKKNPKNQNNPKGSSDQKDPKVNSSKDGLSPSAKEFEPNQTKDKQNNQQGGKSKPQNDKKENKNNSKGNNKDNSKGNKKSAPAILLSPSIPPSQPQQTSDINYGRGQKITILHVAEKPSIAHAIATGLAGNSNRNTRSTKLPVHEFTTTSPFPKAPHASAVQHRVTSVAGHVYAIEFGSAYQSWDSVDPAELFTAPTIRKAQQGSVVRHLSTESKGVDFIVLWMDCDREGENINFEVLDICQGNMKNSPHDSNYDRVYRAYFSAVNSSDIQKAYKQLGKPDRNQALSVDARQELDLKVGVAFSRFQTRYFQGRYGDLDSTVLSYGPCQTPTLGFCVQRHIDIETFKPEPYWSLELSIIKRGRALKAAWDGGRSFNKTKIEKLVEGALEASPVAKVVKVVTKEKKQGRPTPLNTVALLKACSKALGIGPHAAMQTAERLYLMGFLSYPRTESSAYPKSFDIKDMLQQQTVDNRWGSYVQQLLSTGQVTKARGGVDMGDHPPITPCRAARGELSGDMARVYELVVRHNIAAVSPDAVWQSTRVNFEVDALEPKKSFTLSGKELKSPGFLTVLLHKEYGEDNENLLEGDDDEIEGSIPEFNQGEIIPLSTKSESGSAKVNVAVAAGCRGSLNIKERMTTAPGYLTESELIGMMEKHGIGTDASIATHIQNVQNRKYVSLETGRRLIPAKLGLVLVQGYHMIDSSLVLPKIRADIEGECARIAKGLASKDDVIEKALKLFREKFDYFVQSIDKMDVLFGASFSKLEDVGKPFTRCGLTRRYLSYIPGPPVRLYNKYTETVYPLPAGGEIKQWTGRTCSVEGCNFELCLYNVGNPVRTFPLCPRCFNDPDWALDDAEIPEDPVDKEDEGKERQIQKMAGRNLCLECPLPDNHPLIDELTVSPDPDSDGVLILDPHLGPKWRLVSTRDPTIVHLPHQQISKITVLNRTDEVLGVHMMKIEFMEGQSPYPEKTITCCFPQEETLQKMVRVHKGSERTKIGRQGGRGGRGRGGRGRGRGRGGRGRGRR